MAVATYTDVGLALGRPISSEAEQSQIAWWLDGVELFITARLGPVEDLDQARVLYVETEAVAAKVRRSGSLESSITVSVDDSSVTRRFDQPISASDITDEWWNLLDPNAGSGLRSTRPGFEADDAPSSVSTPPATFRLWGEL